MVMIMYESIRYHSWIPINKTANNLPKYQPQVPLIYSNTKISHVRRSIDKTKSVQPSVHIVEVLLYWTVPVNGGGQYTIDVTLYDTRTVHDHVVATQLNITPLSRAGRQHVYTSILFDKWWACRISRAAFRQHHVWSWYELTSLPYCITLQKRF